MKRKEKFTTYCPVDFEDLILYTAFYGIENGCYVDIGANDPVFKNVTKYLYDNKGWSGINIEPLKKEYALLCKDRTKDINLNIGLADKKGELIFYIDGECTTCSEDTVNSYKDRNSLIKEKVAVERLSDVLDKFAEKIKDIHFCKIDVEGFEKNVLMGINFEKHRPSLFCIESTFPCTYIPSYHLWENILTDNGYVLVFAYGVNRYYADKKGKLYETILNNLNVKNSRSNIKVYKSSSLKNNIFIKILKFFWHLLPLSFRVKKVLPFRLKRQCKKLMRILNLDYDITVVFR